MHTDWHLSEKDFFHGLVSEREEFISLATRRIFKKNQFVFFEGDPGVSAFYVESGEVRVFKISPMGKESVFFIRHSGEMFGLAEVIGEENRVCSAQAMTCCILYEIKREELDHLLSRFYPLAKRVMEIMGRRLRYLGEQVENLMVCDVPTRLLKLLLYLCHRNLIDSGTWDSPVVLPVKLTQQQIAEMIGSCQQTVSETLKKFEKEGLIQVSGKEIILLKPTKAMNRVSA